MRMFHLVSEDATYQVVDTRLPGQDGAHVADTPRSVALSGKTALCLTDNG